MYQLMTAVCLGSGQMCFSLPCLHTGTGPPYIYFCHESQIHNPLPLSSGSPKSSPISGLLSFKALCSTVTLCLTTSLHARRINSCRFSLEVLHLSSQPLKHTGSLGGMGPGLGLLLKGTLLYQKYCYSYSGLVILFMSLKLRTCCLWLKLQCFPCHSLNFLK